MVRTWGAVASCSVELHFRQRCLDSVLTFSLRIGLPLPLELFGGASS
jgi:hypothetical protein